MIVWFKRIFIQFGFTILKYCKTPLLVGSISFIRVSIHKKNPLTGVSHWPHKYFCTRKPSPILARNLLSGTNKKLSQKSRSMLNILLESSSPPTCTRFCLKLLATSSMADSFMSGNPGHFITTTPSGVDSNFCD